MWKTLREAMGTEHVNQIKIIQIGDKIYDREIEIANELNKYFVDSIKQINKMIEDVKEDYEHIILNTNTNFRFKEINEEKIISAIKQIKSKGDIEMITPKILNDAMNTIGKLFCSIVNESLTTGKFPDWKCATIIPTEKIKGTIKPKGKSTRLREFSNAI